MRDGFKDQVEQNTLEWNNVAYRLQTMTGKSTIKIVKLFKYPSKISTSKFSNIDKIDSIVDVTDYKMQYRSRVINHTIPLEDIIFFCGHVNIKKYHSEPNKIFTFLICQVNLGKIGKFNDPANQVDSVFIPPETESEPYHFNFLVNNHEQYNVRYQVSFVIGDDHDIRNRQTVCSICEQNLATIYCRDQKMHFCDVCSNDHHLQIKMALENEFRKKNSYVNPPQPQSSKRQQNQQQPIQVIPNIPPHQLQKLNRINSLPLCQNHSIKYEYFCIKCQKYVCNICIQKGTHNQNPQHVIKHIEYLYEEKQEVNNTICTRLKQKLEKLIQNIQELSSSITANYEYVKKELTNEFQMALERLQTAYFDKISKVYSDEIQLNMTYQKIEWTKAFVLHQQRYLRPIHYFKLQARYENQISAIKINGYEESFAIKPDLDYYADWVVGTKPECDQQRARKQQRNIDTVSVTQPKPNNVQNYAHPKNFSQNTMFDSKSEAPKRGQLSLLLQKSNLKFFKFKTAEKPMLRD